MIKSNERWQLPDGIEELLPEQAARVEQSRRQLLDLFASWGYEFVMPPLLEFTESLLVGLGEDLDLQTFKVIDQLSGRMLGVRADITPQTARIDAHSLANSGVQRLCYAGSVLHAKPSGLKASRAPIQLGAELYGVADVSADLEVISLMLEGLRALGVKNLTLDLGDVRVYRELIASAGITADDADQLFELLQAKSGSELHEWLQRRVPDAALREQLALLADLNGGREVLDKAEALATSKPVAKALTELRYVAEQISARFPEVELYFDLSELRGYHYHSGLVFAAYVPDLGRAIANGGRFDNIGAAFGRGRPATGFNADLKALLRLGKLAEAAAGSPIVAPGNDDSLSLWDAIMKLRAAGETVVSDLNADGLASEHRSLVKNENGEWQIQE